jgi:S-methylmethionine-dependent homocysteine/selenocysteine methylase
MLPYLSEFFFIGDNTLPLQGPEDNIVLLDGGLGRELRFRGIEPSETIWSANALLEAPNIIRQIHYDYIKAGADIITVNSYGIIKADLAKEGIEHRFAELNILACKMANEARELSERTILILITHETQPI